MATRFTANIAGVEFPVVGYPYISQDREATLCAHAGLWGVCRYLSERYKEYGEVYPFDLVLMTDYAQGRRTPYRGMTYSDYASILSEFGCYPIVMRVRDREKLTLTSSTVFQDLCSYVESGFPILASIHKHVITLIGHTIDYERKTVPDRQGYIDNSAFWKQFVVIDDNTFPYALLGYPGDSDNCGKIYENKKELPPVPLQSIETIINAVCPLPEKAFLPAAMARKVALKRLQNLRRSGKIKTTKPYVIRLFLTSGASFKKRKRAFAVDFAHKVNGKVDGFSFYVTDLTLPHFIWVMEISSEVLYKKGYCIGEIVLDATAGGKERYEVYWRAENAMRIDGRTMVSERFSPVFKQYTHNLGER